MKLEIDVFPDEASAQAMKKIHAQKGRTATVTDVDQVSLLDYRTDIAQPQILNDIATAAGKTMYVVTAF